MPADGYTPEDILARKRESVRSGSPVRASAQEIATLREPIHVELHELTKSQCPGAWNHCAERMVADRILAPIAATITAAEARGRQQAEQSLEAAENRIAALCDAHEALHIALQAVAAHDGDRFEWADGVAVSKPTPQEIAQAALDAASTEPPPDRVQQAEQARDEAQRELETWRRWAQFVYLGGGPVTLSDQEQRAAICTAHDAQVEGLQASEIALTQALKDYGQHKPPCVLSVTTTPIKSPAVCTCGLDAALTGAQA